MGNDHIAELTTSTVQLDKQLNDCFAKIAHLNNEINEQTTSGYLDAGHATTKYFKATPRNTPSKSPSKRMRVNITPSPRSYVQEYSVKKQNYSPPRIKRHNEDKMNLLDNCSLEDGEHNLFSMLIYDDVEDNNDYLQKGNRERKGSKDSLQSMLVVEEEQKDQEIVVMEAKTKFTANEHKMLLDKIEKKKVKNIKILKEIERLRSLAIVQPMPRGGFCIVQ